MFLKHYHVVILFCLFLIGCGGSKDEAKNKEKVIAVESQKIVLRDFVVEAEYSSSAVPKKIILLSSRLPSPVEKLNIKKGDKVKKDQILIELDSKEFQINYEASKSSYEEAIKLLDKTKKPFRKQEIFQAQSSVSIAKTEYDVANKSYNRALGVLSKTKGAYSKGEMDAREARSKTTLNQLQMAKNKLSLMMNGSPKDIAIAEARVNKAKVAMTLSLEYLSRVKIICPMDGSISELHVEEKELVRKNSPLVEIIDNSQVLFKVLVSENHISFLKLNQECDVYISAVKKKFNGVVRIINNKAEKGTHQFYVEVLVDNKDAKIFAGMVASIKFKVHEFNQVIAVPNESVQDYNSKKGIYIIKANRAKFISIKIIHQLDEETIIEGDFELSDEVVVFGAKNVSHGNLINNIK